MAHKRAIEMAEARIMGYTPGAIGRIVEMHAEYYSKAWKLPGTCMKNSDFTLCGRRKVTAGARGSMNKNSFWIWDRKIRPQNPAILLTMHSQNICLLT